MTTIGLIIIGLAGLIIGGELLVRGAVSAAKAFNISPLVIGLTLVGFGTSTPELVTSRQAALSGSSGIAIGNVVGSNLFNALAVAGVGAVLAPGPIDEGFRLGAAAMVQATDPAPIEIEVPAGKIMIVDDELANVKVAKKILRRTK